MKPACVYSFEQIGITDPFPFENDHQTDMPNNIIHPQELGSKINKNVYGPGRMNKKLLSPRLIYMPRKEILIKLMRACI